MSDEAKETQTTLKETLVAELKDKGLDVLEDAVASAVENSLTVLEVVNSKIDNVFAKSAITLLLAQKEHIMSAIDKIDGEDDAGR